MLRKDLGNVWLSIISCNRPENVKKMEDLVGPASWYVGHGEKKTYKDATRVVDSGLLCESRNAALDDAFKKKVPCVELSDDLSRVRIVKTVAKDVTRLKDIDLKKAVEYMQRLGKRYGVKLVGVAPTTNLFFFNEKRKYSFKNFIVGDFIMVFPSDLRFDCDISLKEDYDFTLQHLKTFGKVLRCNDVFAYFSHRKNKGGAVRYRTSELEQSTIEYLKKKWPGHITDNARRPNEILMKW